VEKTGINCGHSPMRSLECWFASDSVMRERQQPTDSVEKLSGPATARFDHPKSANDVLFGGVFCARNFPLKQLS
jgi:hypothetical protein